MGAKEAKGTLRSVIYIALISVRDGTLSISRAQNIIESAARKYAKEREAEKVEAAELKLDWANTERVGG